MRLKRIEAKNLKNRSFSYDLAPAVAIVGDNFTGKTSILDAIRLLFIGFLPELGKLPRSTWELSNAGNLPMIVQGDIGDDEKSSFQTFTNETISRSFYLDKDTVKLDTLGSQRFADIPLLNASAYFAMTDKQRVDYVFETVPLPEQFTVDAIVARLERISFEEAHTEQIEKAKRETIAAAKAALGCGKIQAMLSAAVVALKETFSHWNKRQKDTVGAVRVLTELKNRENEVSATALSDLEKEIEAAKKELETANQAKGEAMGRARNAEQLASRKERFEALQSDFAQNSAGQVTKFANLISEGQKSKKATLLGDQRAELIKDKTDVQATRVKQVEIYTKARTVVEDCERQLKEIKDLDACPTCHATGKSWKKKLAAELKEKIDAAKSTLRDAGATIEVLDGRLAKVTRQLEDDDSAIRHNEQLAANIQTWEKELAAARKQHEDWSKQLEREKEELAGCAVVGAPTDEEMQRLEGARFKAAAKVSFLFGKKDGALRLQQDLKRAAQSSLEHEDAKAQAAVTKAVLAELATIKSEMVEAVFTDLLKIANAIAGNVLKTPLAFYEGEVGRWQGAKFIVHRTFSGTEQALTFVAVAAALSQEQPLKLLIFDELGRLDQKRRHLVLTLLAKTLEAGYVDQFIVVGAIDRKEIEGWCKVQIIDLNEKAAA